MNNEHIPVHPLKQIGVQIVAIPAHGISADALYAELKALGNPVLQRDQDRYVLVSEIHRIPAAQGQLVWVCEHCGCYDESKAVVERHEQHCKE